MGPICAIVYWPYQPIHAIWPYTSIHKHVLIILSIESKLQFVTNIFSELHSEYAGSPIGGLAMVPSTCLGWLAPQIT